MNSYERIMSVIDAKMPDRTPNANIMMMFAAKEIGVNYKDYCQNSKFLVEGNLACAQKYGIDVVTVMHSPVTEAHDLGAKIEFPTDDVPYPKEPLIKTKVDLLNCKIVDPMNSIMMLKSIQAIQSYKSQVKGELAIIGWVEGCFAQSADLMGVNEFLLELADTEEDSFIEDLFNFILEQEILYAKAQIEAGADIIGVGDAISSVAGPVAYKMYAERYQRKLLTAIKDMGAKTKLHICGNITPFLEDIPYDVCDILDVDWMVDLKYATQISAGRSAISGNYDPVSILLQSTPQRVSDEVLSRLKTQDTSRYISAAGCEVPKHTPEENLLSVKHTLAQN